jgi:hypothetical protein
MVQTFSQKNGTKSPLYPAKPGTAGFFCAYQGVYLAKSAQDLENRQNGGDRIHFMIAICENRGQITE